MAVADWVRMAFLVYSTISVAMSASLMRDSAAWRFSAPMSRPYTAYSSLFW